MIEIPLSPRFLCLVVALFSWAEPDAGFATAFSATTPSTTTTATTPKISPEDVAKIANGGVAVLPNFVPSDLVQRMRTDAKQLKRKGYFRPDGLSNYALGDSLDQQGFTRSADRQTFRGSSSGSQQSWYEQELGDLPTRLEFDQLLAGLRGQLAVDLERPTLLGENHEITYNWYEPGAKLGRHLDEHHEETKGPKGWRYPTRRSVTWLVYLNDHWTADEGGALLCHPRSGHDGTNDMANTLRGGPIGCHEGNIQVGWMDDHTPVYLDAFRETGKTALYSCKSKGSTGASYEKVYWSKRDFDVPVQPIDFREFMTPSARSRFEQISTATKDPRFANTNANTNANTINTLAAAAAAAAQASAASKENDDDGLQVTPSGGTLVLFDSVTLPHSVLEVTGDRQRIAATGWFHEDSQFALGDLV